MSEAVRRLLDLAQEAANQLTRSYPNFSSRIEAAIYDVKAELGELNQKQDIEGTR